MTETSFNERPYKNEKTKSIDYIKSLIEEARNSSNLDDIPKLEKLIELISSKRYGLVWERHAEKVEQEIKSKIPVFKEVNKKNIHDNVSSEDYNFLLEGDNLHSLHLLQKTHLGKIDLIYIDPPYNTGNKDFFYNDNIVDKNDSFAHSKWLSFMERRLRLAQRLLSEDGVIFISIDDNEQAHLKLLMDDIFGESNYINTISVHSKASSGASGGGEDRKLKKNIEYILFYCKNSRVFKRISPIYKQTELMTYIQQMKSNNKSFKYTSVLYKTENIVPFKVIKDGSGNDIHISKVNNYEIKSVKQVAQLENISEEKVYEKYYDQIMTTTNAQTSIRTRVWEVTDSENTMYKATYVPKSGKNKGKVTDLFFMGKQKVLIIWLKDTSEKIKKKIYKKEKIGTFWDGFSWINVSKEGNVKFANGKKPIKMIQQMLKLIPKKDITVLDFFAGSGTTGHAVLEQNAIDGQKRKFIIATNGEVIETTYQRMKNVNNNFPMNLKYFKTEFIDKDDENLEYALLDNVKTLIELEHGVDLDQSDKAVAFTTTEIKNLDLTNIKTVYMREHSHSLMEKNEIERYAGIKIIDVPEYYFSKEMSEAGL
ncbi:site-specific DNA-methyltransferase [Bacillus safensis]|uniref:site-specific DNA-methyltransferase n=1 Tax=Bacillus TaxID=1386 RepID=UPI0007DBF9C6|nr:MULTISPECIES: site-specific DNA-methyltransferase [Bacillus]MCY7585112.1 site-specific DNA-methyltransferase [Bacillus safensis]MCY7589261.1 site-specific DNA-methyltransferase [Bacillus safensis]MCY7610900.1 site-specific DNA-methyltransferase [Bacillus safensis]PRS20001.1 site-specific DNA-methyltransferase [Bacillus safensis]